MPLLWLLGVAGVLLLHAMAIVSFSVAMATPNPFKRMRRAASPEAWGLTPERIALASGEPGWFFAHPTRERLVIVLHGRSRSKAWMLPAIAKLVPHANVLAFDFRGHGEMKWQRTTLGPGEADAVHAAIDWAEARGFHDIVLYGTSMGGAAAIFALSARARASVRGLVTDGTFDRLERVVARVARRLRAPSYLQRSAEALLRRVADFDVARVNPVEHVDGVTVPALFLHGTEDPLVPPDSAAHLAARCPRGRSHFYRGAHDQPDNPAMIAALLTWLNEGLPPVPRPTPVPRALRR